MRSTITHLSDTQIYVDTKTDVHRSLISVPFTNKEQSRVVRLKKGGGSEVNADTEVVNNNNIWVV